MHIGIHVNTLPTTVFINRLIAGLLKNGEHVSVFGTGLQQFEKIVGADYVFFRLYSFLNYSKIIQHLRYSFLLFMFKRKEKETLDQILREKRAMTRHNKTNYYPILWHKPDILHVQWVKGVEQFLWVKEFGIKLVISLRGTHIYMNPLLSENISKGYRRAFPHLDGVHAVCIDVLKEAEKYGLSAKNKRVIYSGLRLNEFPFTPKEKQSVELKLISVGRQSWMKGYNYTLDALHELKSGGVKFSYAIVGGVASEELLFQVTDLALQKEVTFLPWSSINEVMNMVRDSDILVISSVSEGIANTAIEAMALGTLVISTNCGGMSELIKNEENGFLVAKRSPLEIAQAIKKWISMPQNEKSEIILEARKTIEERFSADTMIPSFMALYQKASTK